MKVKTIGIKLISVLLSALMLLWVLILPVSATEVSLEETPVVSIAIDKTLLSEGESATISVKMQDGYKVNYISFVKPITKNSYAVYDIEYSDDLYTCVFDVTDQTEAGEWMLNYISYSSAEESFIELYNSNAGVGDCFTKTDLSCVDFEVIGTNADVDVPELKGFQIDKKVVSVGEEIKITLNIEDEHLIKENELFKNNQVWYKMPSGKFHCVTLDMVDGSGVYEGYLPIEETTEVGVWQPDGIVLNDINDNETYVYNSALHSFGSNRKDLSELSFEVISFEDDEPDLNIATNDETEYVVIFKDGYGKTLSTQKVKYGESAVEPPTPINELYLFDGWDLEFSNVTSDIVITAQWVINPNVEYDYEVEVYDIFEIEVYSTLSQSYTITCNEDTQFIYNLSSTGTIFSDKLYYSMGYEVIMYEPGIYLLYVDGTRSSNTLTYKVRVHEENNKEEPTEPSTGGEDNPTDSTEPSTGGEDKPTTPDAIGLLGDANCDGKVNIKDATEVQKHIAGLVTLSETGLTLADVDDNSNVNIKDATAIQKHIAGMETGFPIGEPFP